MKAELNTKNVFFLFIIVAFLWAAPAIMAQDDPPPEDEESTLQNDAQVAHAENLADAAAAADMEQGLTDAQTSVDQAEEDLATAQASGDEDAIAEAEANLETANAEYDATAAKTLEDYSGESQAEIEAMRADGMGWGEIAHELGVHPGALGLGHTKGKIKRNRFSEMNGDENSEIEAATQRNLKTGWAYGHGKNLSDDGTGAKVKGKDNRETKGNSGNKGSSSNKGNSGGGKGKKK